MSAHDTHEDHLLSANVPQSECVFREVELQEIASDPDINYSTNILDQPHNESAKATQLAARLYYSALDTEVTHGFLTRKRIKKPEGAKFLNRISNSILGFSNNPDDTLNALITPVYDPSGSISSLQIIDDEGTKRFLQGGSISGGWFSFGGDFVTAKCVVIGDDLATLQSIHQSSGLTVVLSYSAENLPKVAAMVRSKNPKCEIFIAVDDKACRLYAEKCHGCRLIEAPNNKSWNDVYQSEGEAIIRKAFLNLETNTHWKTELIIKTKSDGSVSIPCRAKNLILILSHAPDFKGRIKFNELTNQVCIDDNDIDEASTIKLKAQMEQHITDKVSTNELVEAMTVVAFENKIHPIRDYLRSLKWDGIYRISKPFYRLFWCSYK